MNNPFTLIAVAAFAAGLAAPALAATDKMEHMGDV